MSEQSIKAEHLTGSIIIGGNVHGNVTNQGANSSNQTSGELENMSHMRQLAEELSKLREAMKREAKEIDHDINISEVAKAEKAAQANDLSKVLKHLKSAGKWTLDVATRIGVSIAVDAIKQATNLK